MSTLYDIKNTDDRWAQTQFAVQATDAEQLFLWQIHAKDSIQKTDWNVIEWKQDCRGHYSLIGECDGRPVGVSVCWSRLNGVLVAFYEPVSQVVDWELVNDWLNSVFNGRWDGGTRRAHSNAMNFHHCLDFIRNSES